MRTLFLDVDHILAAISDKGFDITDWNAPWPSAHDDHGAVQTFLRRLAHLDAWIFGALSLQLMEHPAAGSRADTAAPDAEVVTSYRSLDDLGLEIDDLCWPAGVVQPR